MNQIIKFSLLIGITIYPIIRIKNNVNNILYLMKEVAENNRTHLEDSVKEIESSENISKFQYMKLMSYYNDNLTDDSTKLEYRDRVNNIICRMD